jgi:hypothetical protein
LFAALIASFGRPAVRLLLPAAVEIPHALPRSVMLSGEGQGALSGPGIRAMDPLDGSEFALSFAEAGSGRRFELLYATRSDLSVAA